MKNTMIPQKEVEALREVCIRVEEIVKNHKSTDLNLELVNDTFNRVHTIMFMDFLSNFVDSAIALRRCLDLDSDALNEMLAKENLTLEEFEKRVMMKTLSDLLESKK